ncbi:MAG: DUF6096 family protein [Dehalobacter sp.]|nr:DUF6096 family protein [Dehalobacter sp.]
MKFKEFKAGREEYRLRLGAAEIVNLEKKLKDNPLNVLLNLDGEGLPRTETLLLILHASLQRFQHGISIEDVNDIYDEYVENGGTFTDLLSEMIEVFRVSGFFKEPPKRGKKKNMEDATE